MTDEAPEPRRGKHRRATRAATGPGATGDQNGQTKDDTDVGWGELPDGDARRDQHEKWLNEQRPPHWE
ncbi:hypothetical protein ACPPVT_04115 [Angustibacter sp. McL0619]|uniref:hypothetical protein n=1 Tax=Angustibacter sp. McL0619 TaxID=3415676 RepID=UPI003CF0DDE0